MHGIKKEDFWVSRCIQLRPREHGFHLITKDILDALPELGECKIGLLHLFIQNTSASLAINENADPDVRSDLQLHFETLAPRNEPFYLHTIEGEDDMPAHIKSILTGCDISIPVRDGELLLGLWQGIYLCEYRDSAGARTVIATLQGIKKLTNG